MIDSATLGFLEKKSRAIRKTLLEMIYHAESGHGGSSLSCVDIITVLKFGHMQWQSEIDRINTDVFILSKGHAAPAWYSALMVAGELDREYQKTFRQIDSPLQGHPDRTRYHGIDVSTGALGQGLSVGIGRALAKQIKKQDSRVYVILGDGECQEGQIWEALMYAGFQKVHNLIVMIDYNKSQNDGARPESLDLTPLYDKLKTFHWNVQEINGHSLQEIHDAITSAKNESLKPSVIIAHTQKGFLASGTCLMEGSHSGVITEKDYQMALSCLEKRSQ